MVTKRGVTLSDLAPLCSSLALYIPLSNLRCIDMVAFTMYPPGYSWREEVRGMRLIPGAKV